jgi:ankyrin repeat protein
VRFLQSETKVSASCQVVMAFKYNFYSQRAPSQIKGAHLAAYFGLREAMMALIEKGNNPESKDNKWNQTPLSWATENGHDAMVMLQLAQDSVDPDSKDNGGTIPLSRAARRGHEAIVKLLLAQDRVDPDS